MTTFQYLWRFIMYRPGRYFINAIAWTIIYLAPIVPGLITKQFFDSLTGNSMLGYGVWGLIALLIAAALGRICLIIIGFITDVHFRFRMGMLLRRNLLEHVLKQPGAQAIPVSPGEAISHFRDDVDQSEEAVSWSVDVFGLTCFAIVSGYILIRIDAQMTMLVFLPIVLVITAAQLATVRLQKYRAASREATSKVTGEISEMFGNVQAIQVAGAEDRVIERFRSFGDNRRKAMLKDRLMTELLDSVFSNSVNLGTGLILLLAGTKMRAGTFTVGDFALFVYYLTFVTQFITNVGKFITYFKQMSVSLERLTFLLQGASAKVLTMVNSLHLKPGRAEKSEDRGRKSEDAALGDKRGVRQGERETPGAASGEKQSENVKLESGAELQRLDVKGLSYAYADTGRGISDIHFSLRRGSFTVVTGAIGSGKTTLVRSLLGLLPKGKGTIAWNGVPVEDPGTFFTPPRSAYTAQVPRLYSDTLRNNILLGQAEQNDSLQQALHAAVLEYDVAQLPGGLDTVIGPRGVKLSGGQAQRTAAARMLVRDAELYVFDDLSSALDVETEQKLWERMFQRRSDATCLVVSHRKTALTRADHIIVMKEGRIEAEGTSEELLQRSSTFRELWYGDERQSE
ncbi:ABC transporter ATP-binding protein [Paenibacillus sp. CGMCC 1.16610]|uniref:ATP-binding cassette domain-containing protein n=1 Tax=Paenibacillus anseongense TaxID=2682845 RepID=A0ABW9UJG6_9BACL|nr:MULTISPECIES: ABC transporter ATP-binding protein [Paenibacillus]MBA2941189.1 ABC transporter ATP-binding protein [Paenibacillus sp. CGMCC 1.16610]MVQ40008.1 ATP-binding cassette domain-containing protein [Paenibacillus anseongense]